MKHDSDDLDFFFDDELGGDTLTATLSDDETTAFEDGEAFDGMQADADEDDASAFSVPTEAATFVQPELDKPAPERIADLLQKMAPRKKTLLSIIRFCEDKQLVDDVNAYIDSLQETNHSVYSAATLCGLLERAGALVRVNEEGELVREAPSEPVVVTDEDGNEYLEGPEQAPTYWLATLEGTAAAANDMPAERMRELLEQNSAYAPIYQRILEMSAREGGAGVKELSEAVDSDPLVQEPRRYVAWFLDQLEECEALTWTSSWNITEIGREALKTLAA